MLRALGTPQPEPPAHEPFQLEDLTMTTLDALKDERLIEAIHSNAVVGHLRHMAIYHNWDAIKFLTECVVALHHQGESITREYAEYMAMNPRPIKINGKWVHCEIPRD